MFVDYWFYFLPSYLLAALMWTCIGRFLLGLFVPPDSNNFMFKAFSRLTEPAVRLTAAITPRLVLTPLLPLVAAFWIFVVRLLFHIIMYRNGLAPHLTSYGVTGG